MLQAELDKLIQAANDRRKDLQEKKGKEYTQGDQDRLANFKRLGELIRPLLKDESRETAALVVWLVYFTKHYDSLVSFIRAGREHSAEMVEFRLDDMQVYLDLCRGLVYEKKQHSTGFLIPQHAPRPTDL